MEQKLSKFAQLVSGRAGIQTQVCLMPDSVHIALLAAVETLHSKKPFDSSHEPQSTSFCLHGLCVCGSWWWVRGCSGSNGFSASNTGNINQSALALWAFFPFSSSFCPDWIWALVVEATSGITPDGEKPSECQGWAQLMTSSSQSSETLLGASHTFQSLPPSLTPFTPPYLPV